MDIVIIAQAYNRKNGANGSLIDLLYVLRNLGMNPIFVAYKRNKYFAKIEAIINDEGILSSLRTIGSLNFIFKKTLNKPVFFCTNIETPLLKKLRREYPDSKILTFQTGDLPNNESQKKVYEERLNIFDYILFQSPKHYLNFKTYYSFCYSKPILTYATTSIENWNFGNQNRSFDDTLIIYCAGSIQPRKNQIFLIQAFQEALSSEKITNCKLIFSGPLLSDAYSEYCKNFIELVESTPEISYLGNRKDYHKIMEDASIIVSPSKEEGLSTIIREAMFMKKCIIASNIDGNIGVLEHNTNSLLFDKVDNTIELSGLIQLAVNSIELREELGANAFAFYLEYLSNKVYKNRIKMLLDTFI